MRFSLSIINKNSLKQSAPSDTVFSRLPDDFSLWPLELLILSPWWIYLSVEIQFLRNYPCTINDGTHGYCARQIPHRWQVKWCNCRTLRFDSNMVSLWTLKGVLQPTLFHTDCVPWDFFNGLFGSLTLRLCSVPSLFVYWIGFQMVDICIISALVGIYKHRYSGF